MDPRTVLGVEAGATMAEIRSRYRVLAQLFHPDRMNGLPDSVQREAERRMKELTAAYSELESQLRRPTQPQQPDPADARSKPDTRPPPPPKRPTPVNPDNRPLRKLRAAVPSPDSKSFWQQAGIQPVMVRMGNRTGLTLALAPIPADSDGELFLSESGKVHLSSSAEGLIDLARGIGPWQRQARSMTARQVTVLQENRYDLTEVIERIDVDVEKWDLPMLIAVFDFTCDLARVLEIDEVIEALAPGSGLHRLYMLATHVQDGLLSPRSARERLDRFDLVSVFDAWSDIESGLLPHMHWHA